MKEYLLKGVDGVWKYNNSKMDFCPAYSEAVEIPEGADVAVRDNGLLYFYNDQGNKTFYTTEEVWVECDKLIYLSGEEHEFLTLQSSLDWKGTSIVWERKKQVHTVTNKPLTKTSFTYDCLLGCYVEPYVGCSNGGYIISVSHSTVGDLVFEVEGSEWDYGILAKEVIFYTEDNQPLSFEQYKEMYYGGV